jgi:acyl-CoA synthetase (AMP-forming)/AMP-acid ligase II
VYPGTYANTTPDKPAVIVGGSGEVVTYRELDEASNRLAQLFRDRGLKAGNHIAFMLENTARHFEVVWAAQRAGLYYTAINSHLSAAEAAYIVDDCGAELVIVSAALGAVAAELGAELPDRVRTRVAMQGAVAGFDSYEAAVEAMPSTPIDDQSEGQDMLYSSGTTGRPKGVEVPLTNAPIGTATPLVMLCQFIYTMDDTAVYLSPAPLYHAAPLRFTMSVQRLGGTVIVMERFDPVEALRLIERYRVTHSQWVPTMFVRMLKLPPESRTGFDLSSHRCAVHAAAPCPRPIKEQMIDWWGPVLFEYYAGTEGNGFTSITSEEWLEHKGSVGRPLTGILHILDENGDEQPTGEAGTIYFAEGGRFEYHNDPEKTAASRNANGWSTLGDVGYVDDEGYLYLTDRKAYMIISGGVNIYPQEAENVLVTHPKVADVAVFGVPNLEFGEEVKAVVQPVDGVEPSPELERELIAFCQEQLAHFKCPRSVDFEPELPRLPTGKLYKRLLRDKYWSGHESRIV